MMTSYKNRCLIQNVQTKVNFDQEKDEKQKNFN